MSKRVATRRAFSRSNANLARVPGPGNRASGSRRDRRCACRASPRGWWQPGRSGASPALSTKWATGMACPAEQGVRQWRQPASLLIDCPLGDHRPSRGCSLPSFSSEHHSERRTPTDQDSTPARFSSATASRAPGARPPKGARPTGQGDDEPYAQLAIRPARVRGPRARGARAAATGTSKQPGFMARRPHTETPFSQRTS